MLSICVFELQSEIKSYMNEPLPIELQRRVCNILGLIANHPNGAHHRNHEKYSNAATKTVSQVALLVAR